MTRDQIDPIVLSGGRWMHIRQIRARHRRYPEVRGEGRSRAEALARLADQLARARDAAPGRDGREAIERALAEVIAAGRRIARGRPPEAPLSWLNFRSHGSNGASMEQIR